MLKCDMELCIHNIDDECYCKSISMDSVGLCTECIILRFPEDVV